MKTTRSRIFLVIIALVFSAGIVYGEKNVPTITKTFDMSQAGALISSSSGGGITVSTHDEAKAVVQVFVRKRGVVLSPNDKDVKEILEAYDLVIEKNGNEITATAKRKMRGDFWNNTGIYFNIIVPREMSCNVSSSGGGLKISGVAGTHDFSSSGGSVKLENTEGNTKAKSSGGSVSAYKHKGDIRLSSSGGGVKLDKAKGSVYAHSSGGSVKLNNINGDVDAHSSGGGVSVTGEAPFVKAKSSGGSVRVNITGLSKEMDLSSSGGGVSAIIHNGENLGMDLDLSSSRVNIDLHNFSGKSEKNRINGTMNGGGIPVYMRASGGNVNVSYEE
jgi:hypothetical protein